MSKKTEQISLTMSDEKSIIYLDSFEDGIGICLVDKKTKEQYDYFISKEDWVSVKHFLEFNFKENS